MARTYDPVTKKWINTDDSSTSSKKDTTTKKTGDDDSSLKASTTDKTSSKGKAEKKANRKVLRTLEGDLNYLPTEQSIKLKAGDTIKLSNLGKYLSGRYYVASITRTLSDGGYSQSAKVLKTNFRKTIKVKKKSKK